VPSMEDPFVLAGFATVTEEVASQEDWRVGFALVVEGAASEANWTTGFALVTKDAANLFFHFQCCLMFFLQSFICLCYAIYLFHCTVVSLFLNLSVSPLIKFTVTIFFNQCFEVDLLKLYL